MKKNLKKLPSYLLIEKLKKLTGHHLDTAFAKFLGMTKNTITRAKRGQKTKLHAVFPILEHLISDLNEYDLWKFREKFKEKNGNK